MMESPRFKVTSLSGYDSHGDVKTTYQVRDTAYCHATIYETPLQRLAEKGVAILNSGELAWPHGYISSIWNGKAGRPACPCERCLEARREAKRAQKESQRRKFGVPMRGNGRYKPRAT